MQYHFKNFFQEPSYYAATLTFGLIFKLLLMINSIIKIFLWLHQTNYVCNTGKSKCGCNELNYFAKCWNFLPDANWNNRVAFIPCMPIDFRCGWHKCESYLYLETHYCPYSYFHYYVLAIENKQLQFTVIHSPYSKTHLLDLIFHSRFLILEQNSDAQFHL